MSSSSPGTFLRPIFLIAHPFHLLPWSSFLDLEREAHCYQLCTWKLPFPALLARGAWGRGEGWGSMLPIHPSDFPVGTSRTNAQAKRRGRENTQTSWNNICWVNVWRTWRNWLDIVQFCFKGNPGLNQGTKFIGVGERTGKHFVLETGKLFSRSEGKRLKE